MCIAASVGRGGANNAVDVKTVQVLLNLNLAAVAGSTALAVDGQIGDATVGAIDAFQGRVLGMAPPDGRVDPGGATLRALAAGIPPGFSSAKLQGIMPHATARNVATYAPVLAAKMAARGLDAPLRQAHFLAQLGHESGELRYTEELASGVAYEGRTDLGNTHPGDGRKFKGRGLIQLTGRANYAAYGTAIGIDLIDGDNCRRLATDPELAVDVACWFWERHGLSPLADQDDVRAITRRINGGLNGLAERERLLGRGKFFLLV
jgi:putative chitinase